MSIHVCSLARLHDTVAATGARHVVTLINVATPVARPAAIAEPNHLFIGINDIVEDDAGLHRAGRGARGPPARFRPGAGTPSARRRWWCTAGPASAAPRRRPSSPSARWRPARDEFEIALALRAASPTATPNLRIVRHADALLGRRGRMVAAIEAIGRGIESPEGAPFASRSIEPRPLLAHKEGRTRGYPARTHR